MKRWSLRINSTTYAIYSVKSHKKSENWLHCESCKGIAQKNIFDISNTFEGFAKLPLNQKEQYRINLFFKIELYFKTWRGMFPYIFTRRYIPRLASQGFTRHGIDLRSNLQVCAYLEL